MSCLVRPIVSAAGEGGAGVEEGVGGAVVSREQASDVVAADCGAMSNAAGFAVVNRLLKWFSARARFPAS
jgi:hypothetical protein